MQETSKLAVAVVDVEAVPGRPALTGAPARAVLREVLLAAVTDLGMPWASFRAEDRGDGVLLAPEPEVSPATLVSGLIAAFDQRLQGRPGVRARIAVDLGAVVRRDDCWSGEAVETAFRLVDSPLLGGVLSAAERARAVVAVSDLFFQTIIRGRIELNPVGYGPATIDDDDGRAALKAWIQVPGYPGPPGIQAPQAGYKSVANHPASADREGAGMSIGSIGYVGGDVINGSVYKIR